MTANNRINNKKYIYSYLSFPAIIIAILILLFLGNFFSFQRLNYLEEKKAETDSIIYALKNTSIYLDQANLSISFDDQFFQENQSDLTNRLNILFQQVYEKSVKLGTSKEFNDTTFILKSDTLIDLTYQQVKIFPEYLAVTSNLGNVRNGLIAEILETLNQLNFLDFQDNTALIYPEIAKATSAFNPFLQEFNSIDQIFDRISYSLSPADSFLLYDIVSIKNQFDDKLTQLEKLKSEKERLIDELMTNQNSALSLSLEINDRIKARELRFSIIIYLSFSLFLLFSIGTIIFLVFDTVNSSIKPTIKIRTIISSILKGNLNTPDIKVRKSSIYHEMVKELNSLIKNLSNAIVFANSVKEGNLDAEYNLSGTEDKLGLALIEMKESLIESKRQNEEKEKNERIQSWTNSGSAKVSEILNRNYNSLEDFAFTIIKTIVKYLDANQGAMFLVNDNDESDKFLELKAAFAYERRKYSEKIFKMGEGFVGTAAVENKTIYRTELPENYIHITSGLGDAPPNVLLIVPLYYENNVFGVVELASFNELEPYKIEFVERISELISTTLNSAKNKEKTEKLLKESQAQAEKIAQAEEEMRQNMEELQATQEEAERREKFYLREIEQLKARLKE